ncbi:helix-turn-helix transcriptional regulator [Rhodospirillum sp. A1_3_36]|uniref:helix-turn-helix transcriptional regulator n=1 Tax=Rhodospirillum sp. A1_3_36 TaxID=3391666 RepID=UPI0039A42EF5
MATNGYLAAESIDKLNPEDLALLETYITGIGERIKVIRSRRGMTRKDLSRHSGVSERYLAQAEKGKANFSIAILWRISHALNVEIPDLFPGAEEDPGALHTLVRGLSPVQRQEAVDLLRERFLNSSAAGHGVALIGLRGAGKTRLGSLLADEFKVPFIRLGAVVEKLAQMDIGELISLGGQKAFRRVELQALKHVIETHPRAVVEAGGSLVSETETFKLLLSSYHTVWIKAAPEEHMQRVIDQGDLRPMSGNDEAINDLREILKEREPEYRLANSILDTTGRSITDCIIELVNHTRPYLTKQDEPVKP